MNKNSIIRKIYLYLFSLVGLVLITIGGVQLVNLGLKTYIFTKADQYYEYPAVQPVKPGSESTAPNQKQLDEFQKNQQASQRQREVSTALAMIIIGTPLFLYHWSRIKKDQKEGIGA
jgi:hypothetical protein